MFENGPSATKRRSARSRFALLCAALLAVADAAPALDDEAFGFERTPPRLSFLDGAVSFFRPGAEDWTPARVNTALAAGDELFSGADSNLELQIGARAFARAGAETQLGLTALEPDYLQIRVATGSVSLDLRSLRLGQTLELATPNAAFRVERSGYYRVEVVGDTTTFTTRRGGQATLTSASGDSALIAASEQVIVRGTDAPQLESYAAPELDAWDRWNYARTDDQLDAVSARYVPSDVYGVDDLDHHGDWRLVPSYGAVWVPRQVGVGWVPYSNGRWLYDPWYGWTWLDDSPWGWAPYHYGRWVRVSGFWGWCPGPSVRRAYYSPALVAFYGGGPHGVGAYAPARIGWVALGYGEPLRPWWGPAHFRGKPRWAGWGGPRRRYDDDRSHDHDRDEHDGGGRAHDYQNAHERGAIVSVEREHFGRRSRHDGTRFTRATPKELTPLDRDLDVAPDPSSLVPEVGAAERPPRDTWQRPVVATREPRAARSPDFEATRAAWKRQPRREQDSKLAPETPTGSVLNLTPDVPPTRVVSPAPAQPQDDSPKRAPFSRRGDTRRMPPPAPRFEAVEPSTPSADPQEVGGSRQPEPRDESSRPAEAAAPRNWPRSSDTSTDSDASRNAERETRWQRGPDVDGSTEATGRSGPHSTSGSRQRNDSSDKRERRDDAPSSARELPGEPANRVYRPNPKWEAKQQQRANEANPESR